MKRVLFLKSFVVAGVLVVAGCSEVESPDKGKVIRRETVSQSGGDVQMLPKVKADRLLVVELKGMMCEKGCGSSIRSRLYASEAVESVSFEFDEKNPVDVAKIAFDRSKISADEIVEIIGSMEKGKYEVTEVKSEPYVSEPESGADNTNAARSEKSAKVELSSTLIESTDIYDIFSFF